MAQELPARASRLYLPDGYLENPPRSSDAEGTPFWREEPDDRALRWQIPVYRRARRRFRDRFQAGTGTVLDVGCGTGHKLVWHFARVAQRLVGVDQGSGIGRARSTFADVEWIDGDLTSDDTWRRCREVQPDLLVCADVIEHMADPIALLEQLHDVASPDALLVLSTPDRSRLDRPTPLGPPGNARHIREWTMDELRSLVEACGFAVSSSRRVLPRSYAITRLELKRQAWRVLHGRAVPDRRSCSVLELTAAA